MFSRHPKDFWRWTRQKRFASPFWTLKPSWEAAVWHVNPVNVRTKACPQHPFTDSQYCLPAGLPQRWLANTEAPDVDFNLHAVKTNVFPKISQMTQWTLSPPLCPPTPIFETCKCAHVNSSIPGVLCGLSVKVGIRHSAGLCVAGPQFMLSISRSTWVTPSPEFKSPTSPHELSGGRMKERGVNPLWLRRNLHRLTDWKYQL